MYLYGLEFFQSLFKKEVLAMAGCPAITRKIEEG